jgi:hypothetical protein
LAFHIYSWIKGAGNQGHKIENEIWPEKEKAAGFGNGNEGP